MTAPGKEAVKVSKDKLKALQEKDDAKKAREKVRTYIHLLSVFGSVIFIQFIPMISIYTFRLVIVEYVTFFMSK